MQIRISVPMRKRTLEMVKSLVEYPKAIDVMLNRVEFKSNEFYPCFDLLTQRP